MTWTGSQWWAVGETGLITKSTDGLSWVDVSYATNRTLYSIWYEAGNFIVTGGFLDETGLILTSNDGETWQPHEFENTNFVYDVVSNGSLFVATAGEVVLRSPDGESWTEVAIPIDNASFGCGGVDQPGRFYVGGTHLLRTTDSVNWTLITDTLTDIDLRSVATNGTTIVAVGLDGLAFQSQDDGHSWHEVSGVSSWDLRAVVSNGSSFVAAGSAGIVSYSPSGLAWTITDLGPQTFEAATHWKGNFYVAADNEIWRSSNGIDWNDVSPQFQNEIFFECMGGNQQFLVAGGYGDDFDVVVSFDGTTWVETQESLGWDCCVAGNDDIVVLGSMRASHDGVSWFDAPSPATVQEFEEMIWNGEVFVATGNKKGGICAIATSLDGLHWTEHYSNLGGIGYGITWHHDKFVLVGSHGMIAENGCRSCGLLAFTDWPQRSVQEFVADLCE